MKKVNEQTSKIPLLEIHKPFLQRAPIPTAIEDYYFQGEKTYKFRHYISPVSQEEHDCLEKQIMTEWDNHMIATVRKGESVKAQSEPGISPEKLADLQAEEEGFEKEKSETIKRIESLSRLIKRSLSVDVPMYSWVAEYLVSSLLKGDAIPDLQEYEKGFHQGYTSSFIPFIDTVENRRELVVKEVNKPEVGFPSKRIVSNGEATDVEYDPSDIFEYGNRVGRIYKAWELVFENPFFFEEGFQELLKLSNSQQQSVSDSYKNKVTPLKAKSDPEFEEIFRYKHNAQKLVQLLKLKGFVDGNEKWLSGDTHIVPLYGAMLEKGGILKLNKATTLGRIFCRRFGVTPFSDRTAREFTSNRELFNEFAAILEQL